MICIAAFSVQAKPLLPDGTEVKNTSSESVSSTEILRQSSEPKFFSLKDKLDHRFQNTPWITSKTLLLPENPIPYNAGETEVKKIFTFASADNQGSIHCRLTGLGELNYSGVPYDQILFCENLSASLKAKKLNDDGFVSARPFLKYFFSEKLAEYPAISAVFYGRPESNEEGVSVKFRLNFGQTDQGLSYTIATIHAVYETDNLKLSECEFGDICYEKLK